MKKEDLIKLIDDDDLGLLSVKSKNASSITADERLIASFVEINNFVKENGREPQSENGLKEHQLSSRLKSMREDENKTKILLDFDECNLLNIERKKITSVNEVIEDDDLGLLDNIDASLFKFKNVPQHKNKNDAEFIARRKPCKNFDKYEPLFKLCQSDLATGKRKLLKFTSEKQVKKNSFFVLNGVLLFIENIGKTYINKYGKINGRQRCIFENGTESEMLFRSLVQRLYENGHAVSENIDSTETDLIKNFGVITDEDSQTGYIYVVRSLSSDPKIQSLENLYKIGFSTIPVEERIKNASEDATFLMAPVSIVTTFECYNLNPQKLEQLLHNFFGSACLNVDIFDVNNRRCNPREWFIAPLSVIERVVHMIITGEIVNYKYDSEKQNIVARYE